MSILELSALVRMRSAKGLFPQQYEGLGDIAFLIVCNFLKYDRARSCTLLGPFFSYICGFRLVFII